jgi:hypothetical protein
MNTDSKGNGNLLIVPRGIDKSKISIEGINNVAKFKNLIEKYLCD